MTAELLLRCFWYHPFTISAGKEHPHFHHRYEPSAAYHFVSPGVDVHVQINRYGLRGAEPAMPKPPGTVRIVMLGDSFTFGYGVQDQETFSALIEQELRARGLRVEVVNGGQSGYSPLLEYLLLRDQLLAFEPDLVMLWYDISDLKNDADYEKNLIYDLTGRIVRCDPAYINGRFDLWEWLRKRVAVLKYVDCKVVRAIGRIRELGLRKYADARLHGKRTKLVLAEQKRAEQVKDLPKYDVFFPVREDTTAELLASYWEVSGKYIRLIRDLLNERHIPLIMGIYPVGVLIGPDQWAQGRFAWGFQANRVYSADAYEAVVASFARSEGIALINTFPQFKAAAKRDKLFLDWDGHLSPAGHRVLAQSVLRDARFLGRLRMAAAAAGSTTTLEQDMRETPDKPIIGNEEAKNPRADSGLPRAIPGSRVRRRIFSLWGWAI